MCAKMAFQHQAGTAMECLSVSKVFLLIYMLGNAIKNLNEFRCKKYGLGLCYYHNVSIVTLLNSILFCFRFR